MSTLDSPIVSTRQGLVRGVWREHSAAFLGIPFGEPPVGDLRFAAPKPHAPWPGVRDAQEFGATPQRVPYAPQTLIPEPSIPGDSTLNVNVFTPRPITGVAAGKTAPQHGQQAGLPVLVFFHGGAYVAGSPASSWYDGSGFNRDHVVTVTVSYRLGFDGFGWISDAPHNRAVLDWLLALQWVQDNISAFGGDPKQVTLAGQSAGGGAVLTLLTMPLAQPLFARAISLSGVTTTQTKQTAQDYGTRLAHLAGVPPTRVGLSTLTERELISLTDRMAQLQAGEDPLEGTFAMVRDGLVLAPYVDGELIPYATVAGASAGIGADKPLLLGSADHEFNTNLAQAGPALAGFTLEELLGRLGMDPVTGSQYIANHPGLTTVQAVGQAVSDLLFRAPTLAVAQARAKTDPRSTTWLYRFGWPSPTLGAAVHCLDVPLFFDNVTAPTADQLLGPNPPESLIRDYHGAMVRFIHGHSPLWEQWTESTRQSYLFAVPSVLVSNAYSDVSILVELPATGGDSST